MVIKTNVDKHHNIYTVIRQARILTPPPTFTSDNELIHTPIFGNLNIYLYLIIEYIFIHLNFFLYNLRTVQWRWKTFNFFF